MPGRAPRRSTTRRTSSGLEISIPAKLHLFVFVFLSVWLLLWLATEYFALQTMLTEREASINVFSVIWTLAGVLGLYIQLWMIAGREIITAEFNILTIKHTLFGWVRVREYDFQHVADLRADVEPYDSEGPRLSAVYPFRTGSIAFEYEGKTIRFADGVGDAEAREIVAMLSPRHQERNYVR